MVKSEAYLNVAPCCVCIFSCVVNVYVSGAIVYIVSWYFASYRAKVLREEKKAIKMEIILMLKRLKGCHISFLQQRGVQKAHSARYGCFQIRVMQSLGIGTLLAVFTKLTLNTYSTFFWNKKQMWRKAVLFQSSGNRYQRKHLRKKINESNKATWHFDDPTSSLSNG